MTVTAIAKKAKRTITEDLGLTEIICPSAVPVTIENISKIMLREVKVVLNKQDEVKKARETKEQDKPVK